MAACWWRAQKPLLGEARQGLAGRRARYRGCALKGPAGDTAGCKAAGDPCSSPHGVRPPHAVTTPSRDGIGAGITAREQTMEEYPSVQNSWARPRAPRPALPPRATRGVQREIGRATGSRAAASTARPNPQTVADHDQGVRRRVLLLCVLGHRAGAPTPTHHDSRDSTAAAPLAVQDGGM